MCSSGISESALGREPRRLWGGLFPPWAHHMCQGVATWVEDSCGGPFSGLSCACADEPTPCISSKAFYRSALSRVTPRSARMTVLMMEKQWGRLGFIGCVFCVGYALSLWVATTYHLHWMNKELRREVTCSRSPKEWPSLGLSPGSLLPQPSLLTAMMWCLSHSCPAARPSWYFCVAGLACISPLPGFCSNQSLF